MSTPLQLADGILASGLHHIHLEEWVVDALIEDGVSQAYAIETSSGLVPRVREHLQQRLEAMVAKGIDRPLVWIDEVKRMTLVSPDVMIGLSPVGPLVGEVRRMLHASMRDLSGYEFEGLIRSALTGYGMNPSRYSMTGKSRDGGIDFCVEWVPDPTQRNRLARTRWRILGQSKLLWNATVGPNDLKGFAKVVDDFRHDRRIRKKVPTWFRDVDYPVLGLFVTAGHLGGSAKEIARDNLIVTIEGDQLADDLRSHGLVKEALQVGAELNSELLREVATPT